MIFKLADRAGFDSVVIEPIAASDAGGLETGPHVQHPLVVRSSALQTAAAGTFWDIELEDEKTAPVTSAPEEAPPRLSPTLKSRDFLSSVSLPLSPVPFTDGSSPRSVKSLSKLVAVLVPNAASNNPEALLREGIPLPPNVDVDFVGVGPNRFARRQDLVLITGQLFASRQKAARFPIFELSGSHQEVALSGKVVRLYRDGPAIEEHFIDLRTADEKDRALRELLERAASSEALSDADRRVLVKAGELVEAVCLGSLDAAEIEIARRTLDGIVDRTPLHEILPSLLKDDPAFAKEIRNSIEEAKQRALAALDAEIALPRKEAELELASARETLETLKREASIASERVRAFGEGAAAASAQVKHDIEEAVIHFLGENAIDLCDRVSALERSAQPGASTTSLDLQRVVDSLVADTAFLGAISTAVDAMRITEPETVEPSRELASDGASRSSMLEERAHDASVSFGTLASIFAISMSGRLPALYGQAADQVAEALCRAVAGDEGFAIVHCDPTLVSLGDIVGRRGEFLTPLKDAIEIATKTPDMLVPVLFRNINYAPCQFWLQAVTDRKSGHHLPGNLVVVATLATDETRVGIPSNLWKHLVPLAVEASTDDSADASRSNADASDSRPWGYTANAVGPTPPDLSQALLQVAKNACRGTIDGDVVLEADAVLRVARRYLELYPEDLETGFDAPLRWKHREHLEGDKQIAEAIEILKG